MGERTPARRACDRCHTVKEKCRRIYGQETCERCHRLQSPCRSLRPIATAGRKPRHQCAKVVVRATTLAPCDDNSPRPSSPKGSNTPPATAIRTSLSMFTDLDERELQLLNAIPQGQTRIDQFLIGPSFRVCHQQTVFRHLCTATDALIASSALIACEQGMQQNQQDRLIGHRRAASAVSTLRSLRHFGSGDLSFVLMLAYSATTVALYISGSAFAICRHSLHLIKPLYESSMELEPESLAFLICLIYSETAECLIRCEIPTVRFRAQHPERLVDRSLGIASPMLPHLYDICNISENLRNDASADGNEILKALDTTEMAVDKWKPTLPENFMARFSQAEAISMLAQANVYRWSILLISHRLRYPYGTRTSKGAAISDAILDELDLTIRLTNRSVPCVDLAFLVACFELTDPRKRQIALEKTDVVVDFGKQLPKKIKTLLMTFWAVRDTKAHFHWFDVSSLLPQ